ncbi:MAG: hypothetical protein R2772_05565 [Chitinophagales bacterium]
MRLFSITLSGSGAVTYTWDNGVTDAQSFVSPVGTTTYVVTGTDANGCVNQDSLAIVVNALPIVGLSTSGNNVCIGTSIVLSGSGAVSYTWNNGVVDGQSFVPPVGTTTYVVTGTDANGCINQDSIDILVNPLPVLVANTSDNNVCIGTSIVLSGSGADTYTWNNGVVDGQSFNPPVGTTTYVVTGTDANACVNQDSIAIVVNPLPIVVANANNTSTCEDLSVVLTGSGAYSYVWDNGVVDGLPFISPVGNTTYQVVGTDVNGCVNQASIDILVYPLPTITANTSGNMLCEGYEISLTASGASTYVWNNGVVNGQPFAPPAGITDYTVMGTDIHGCVAFDTATIEIFALPNVVANTSGDNLCEGSYITLTGTGAQSYTWSNGVSNGLAFIPPVGTQVYEVMGTDSNGCVNTDTISVSILHLGILNEMADQVLCDVSNFSVLSSSFYVESFQWYEMQNSTANALTNDANFSGVNTNHLDVSNFLSPSTFEFLLEMEGECGNLLYDTVHITTNVSPNVDELQDTSLCMHETNIIFADYEGINFQWSDGTLGQYFSPEYTGFYYVSFEEENTACIISDSLYIEMEDCIDQCVLLAPSGFESNPRWQQRLV